MSRLSLTLEMFQQIQLNITCLTYRYVADNSEKWD